MILSELKEKIKGLSNKVSRGRDCLCVPEKKKEIKELKRKTEEPAFWEHPREAKGVLQELSALEKIVTRWDNLLEEIITLEEILEFVEDDSPDRQEIENEYEKIFKRYTEAEFDLLFSGEFDQSDSIIEINAGAGGTEAQDWAEMLLRMYLRFAERHGFHVEILEKTYGTEAGIKSVLLEIKGERCFGLLRGEKGTHRLVRQSPFNAKNLRQTSFAGVIVTPVIKNADQEVQIEEKDIRIDTFRASGAGGQHVNKTDSAVRITYLPLKIVVECQNQRSQHQNKEKALEILRAKILAKRREEEEKKAIEIRGEISDVSWGTQIRNYVLHPYKMTKDLRTGYESGNPEIFLDGDLDECIRTYLEWDAERKNTSP
jgi:peptide chain release factor 2